MDYKERAAIPRSATKAREDISSTKHGILNIYRAIAKEGGHIDNLLYLAGGGDGFATMLANHLYIVDRTLFWRALEKDALATTLTEGTTLAKLEATFPQETSLLIEQIREAEEAHVTNYDSVGYQTTSYIQVLPALLGALSHLGINLHDITLAASPEGYTLSYQDGSQVKTITYIQQELVGAWESVGDPIIPQRRSAAVAGAEKVRRQLTPIFAKGRNGMLIKADFFNVNHTFGDMDPQVVIYDRERDVPTQLHGPNVSAIRPEEYGILFGYGSKVHVLKRE